MTFTERVVRGSAARSHIVQLFDDERSRASAIAAYTADGLSAGDTVLIVAQPSHWKPAAAICVRSGVDVTGAADSGQLTVLQASRTLKKFTTNGLPDPARFDRVVGALVRRLLERGQPLRAYGEMVDLLAGERDFAGAVRLEEMWNSLGAELPFTLFCGYSSSHFAAEQSASALELVCRCHSGVRSAPADDLASWLLVEETRRRARAG